jgi:hypothetical protein
VLGSHQGDGAFDLLFLYAPGWPMLQDHLLKVNHFFFFFFFFFFGQAISAQDVYECMEGDFHPSDRASMRAQMPKLFCLSLVLRKGLCCADLLGQFGMTSAL